jgi:membrane fusion protein, multidrug efflux system
MQLWKARSMALPGSCPKQLCLCRSLTTPMFHRFMNLGAAHEQNATARLQKARIEAAVSVPGVSRSMSKLTLMTALSSMVLVACGPTQEAARSAPPKNVLVTRVHTMDVPVQLHQFGRLTSPETINIQPQVSGRVTEVHFIEGQEVKKGDLLFIIDPRPFQADLEQAQGQLKSDQAQLGLNQRNLQRDEQIGRFVSAQQIDADRSQVENFQGAVAKDQAAIDLAKLNLEYSSVRSPADGRTGRRLVDPGNYVAAGGSVLVNIQRLDPVYVDFTISENDLARLRENMALNRLTVQVTTPSKPEVVKEGSLTFLDNSVSTQAGTVLLRATIPNPDRYLWPGQYVNVALTLQILKDALVVPNQTVQIGGKGEYLFTLRSDNTVEQRQVKQGVRYRELAVVSEGVSAGDTVVVEGQLALNNGMKVNPMPYHSGTQTVQPQPELSSSDAAESPSAGETPNKARAKQVPAL